MTSSCLLGLQGIESFLYTPLHKSLFRHVVLTVFMVFLTLVVGASTNDLGVVLAFNVRKKGVWSRQGTKLDSFMVKRM